MHFTYDHSGVRGLFVLILQTYNSSGVAKRKTSKLQTFNPSGIDVFTAKILFLINKKNKYKFGKGVF